VIEVEILDLKRAGERASSAEELRRLARAAVRRAGVDEGHLAIAFVGPPRITELNAAHRGRDAPTDVLSFPIDGSAQLVAGTPRELGDVVICPEHTKDIREAVVHGVLHLLGYDHERDDGEMLELQRALLAGRTDGRSE
jgi:probable rRNA maturation factor